MEIKLGGNMRKKEKVKRIISVFSEKYGKPRCALDYDTPFELLVAVILSAQCTDIRVNLVTRELFKKYNKPEEFADLPVGEIEELVRSTGFYKNKAKNIKAASKKILDVYNGTVPMSMDELISLPGVGRKTANVVRAEIWGLADGVVVDTHVKRLSNRIGLVKNDNPNIIERELMKIVPVEDWIDYSHFLILHGRSTCNARKPLCQDCEINDICKYGKKVLKSKHD
jgi:endonuclease III